MGTTPNGLRYPEAGDVLAATNEYIEHLADDVDAYVELPFMSWLLLDGDPSGDSGTWLDLAAHSGSGVEYEKSDHFSSFGVPFTYTGPTWLFLATAFVSFPANGVAAERMLRVLRNGTDTVAFAQNRVGADMNGWSMSIANAVRLESGDTIRASALEDSGSDLGYKEYAGFSLAPIRPLA